MSSNVYSCIAYLGADFVAHAAGQQLAEFDLSATVRSRCVEAFINPALERDAARQRLYLLAAIGDRKVVWPRLVYWKGVFDDMGGERPYTWTRGIFPTERRRANQRLQAPAPLALKTDTGPARNVAPATERRRSAAIKLEERHHAALLGLLQHYIQFVCYAERDRRHIANLGAEASLTLSRDAVENRIEKLWLEGAAPDPLMWRPEPPFFPGHRATLRPRQKNGTAAAAASLSPQRNIWVVSL